MGDIITFLTGLLPQLWKDDTTPPRGSVELSIGGSENCSNSLLELDGFPFVSK